MSKNFPPLLRQPSPEAHDHIVQAIKTIARLFPVPASHRRELPASIRDLSRMLTEDRSEMARPYWASPGLSSAYLYFFLPWNLYRLAWLLPGLDLHLAKDARILDLGSGPLTLPIALWCARPDLRGLPLHFACVDVSLQAMERGLAILKALAGDALAWDVRLFRGPLEKGLRGASARQENGRCASYDCIMAANVLNELGNERTKSGTAPLEQRLAELVERMLANLAGNGRILLVEPGTRLGGKVISLSRASAISMGCKAIAPCPHSGPCPMQPRNDEADMRSGPSFSGWCHFTHPVFNPPEVLVNLGEEARMHKRSMALSCVLLEKIEPERQGENTEEEAFQSLDENLKELTGLDELEALFAEIMEEDQPASGIEKARHTRQQPDILNATSGPLCLRVISSPIELSGREEPGRYACCEKGLALLLDARTAASGALVEATPLQQPQSSLRNAPNAADERDRKSGAILFTRVPAKKTEKSHKKRGPEARP